MPCEHPIWIRNRRYFDRKRPRVGFGVDDDHKTALALRPWDISRQWLLVPCGKCEDCLRRSRNDWFVRLERELARCKAYSQQAIFITITINPKYYSEALESPSWFIRKWMERVRHKVGHSFKHALFQEFGEHPETGPEPRLHFHGFLFGLNISYDSLRRAVGDLGWIWISKASKKRARYTVKYVVKQILYNGNDPLLRRRLADRRYTRKFISAGVGNYLGNNPAPSASVYSWSYLDLKSGCRYEYAIPRYYDRYLTDAARIVRDVRSADAYARFSRSALVRRVSSLCCDIFLPHSSLAARETLSWQQKQVRKFESSDRKIPPFDPPVWLDRDILDFWSSNYQLQLII